MFESVTGYGPTVDEVGDWIRLASYLLNGLAAIAALVVSIVKLTRMRRAQHNHADVPQPSVPTSANGTQPLPTPAKMPTVEGAIPQDPEPTRT